MSKASTVGELMLLIGLLILAWMVWAQQEELNRIAMALGDLEARTAGIFAREVEAVRKPTQPRPKAKPKPQPEATG